MIEWKDSEGRFTRGKKGFIGKFCFFDVFYDSLRSRDSSAGRYKLTCHLPNIKSSLGNFDTEELAFEKAEEVLQYWLSKTDLQRKETK